MIQHMRGVLNDIRVVPKLEVGVGPTTTNENMHPRFPSHHRCRYSGKKYSTGSVPVVAKGQSKQGVCISRCYSIKGLVVLRYGCIELVFLRVQQLEVTPVMTHTMQMHPLIKRITEVRMAGLHCDGAQHVLTLRLAYFCKVIRLRFQKLGARRKRCILCFPLSQG